jgi:hypothetical protein
MITLKQALEDADMTHDYPAYALGFQSLLGQTVDAHRARN